MPRCNDCNKFAALDTEVDPEIVSEDLLDDAVSLEVRIVNQCAECGAELTEAAFQFEFDLSEETIKHAEQEGHDLSLSVNASRIERQDIPKNKSGKPYYRAAKTFYGAEVEALVTCACGEQLEDFVESQEIQASQMDECY
jgi:hypothetical protein